MLKIKGIDKEIAKLKREVDAKRKTILIEELSKVLIQLKANTPVDTGEARDGWFIDDDSIKNDVPHIVNLNKGSSKQAPSFFIEKTILSNRELSAVGIIVNETK